MEFRLKNGGKNKKKWWIRSETEKNPIKEQLVSQLVTLCCVCLVFVTCCCVIDQRKNGKWEVKEKKRVLWEWERTKPPINKVN
jgi:hypothetical protein